MMFYPFDLDSDPVPFIPKLELYYMNTENVVQNTDRIRDRYTDRLDWNYYLPAFVGVSKKGEQVFRMGNLFFTAICTDLLHEVTSSYQVDLLSLYNSGNESPSRPRRAYSW